ncbi:efflux pump, RND family, membrane fusion protein [Geotalea daltonii FRC-32]|uniref:Efflux pump, RND family, membrane fusion protein n=1 Tax=Geotalea daltonii (strain DSM 22248 / JCM 15807 / FRC-32) TaxID=316067 RepID=B9M8P2_GEODF|nr:efflux RND transporter periplasmic adaptor subunit [Geotalea daltonii]ACM18577.1 efflux pump, RND family, membrane fusion protein [Geotalea daltonii FRC-32]
MRRLLILVILIPLAVASGCGKKEAAKAPEAAKQAAAEPKKEAEAGLCKEHGVLEALCTKCNPKLAPIFQAKGDWCAEHGFPESVCPICHPERGGKPAMDVAGDDAPPDGTKVILKGNDTARLAGIETTKAVAGRGTAAIIAPVIINYDATRVAQVSARATGVVKRVSADIGDRVSAGAPLAVIESSAVSGDQSRLAAARSRVQTAEASYRREAELEKKGISAKKEVQAAQQFLREATAELESLQATLRGVGAHNGSGGRYTVKAPVSGVVTQRTVSLDRYVDSQTPLFEIVDTSSMWAEVALPEAELGTVKAGASVVVTMDGLSGREFRGSISHIAPVIDPQTRTAKARVKLANPGGLLRANMYGQARISAGGSRSSSAVPRGAVQRAKSVKLAFVRLAPNEFEARRVQVASNHGSGDLVEIASGVEVGEEIVVAGSFLLKTETLKDSIGAGCCEVDTK